MWFSTDEIRMVAANGRVQLVFAVHRGLVKVEPGCPRPGIVGPARHQLAVRGTEEEHEIEHEHASASLSLDANDGSRNKHSRGKI